jgi:IS5 family transposase
MARTELMKAMKQLSLAETGFLPTAGKQTRKAVFLAEMETVVPWSRLESLIEPFYPKKGNGRPPMPLGTMLRIHFMQQWFGYSDPAMEEALHDIPPLRRFAGLNAFEEVMPDEGTILRFRHLLQHHDLATAFLAEVAGALSEKGLSMKQGTVVDATLVAAPSSTKNQDKQRDPEMTKTRKGNQWHFGMTSQRRRTAAGWSRNAGCGHQRSEAAQMAHIRVDAQSGLIHSVECTTAKVADITMMDVCLHGEETIAFGDRVYHKANRTIEHFEKEGDLSILTPTKKPAGGTLTDEQKAFNRMLSAVRAIVEHPFRVIKRQCGIMP